MYFRNTTTCNANELFDPYASTETNLTTNSYDITLVDDSNYTGIEFSTKFYFGDESTEIPEFRMLGVHTCQEPDIRHNSGRIGLGLV